MAMAVSCQGSGRPSTCPPWLQAALADIERRVHTLVRTMPGDPTSDSFAERAENYYQKRPQLLSLVQDLHNRYLHLADRYSHSLRKLTSSSSSSSAAAHTELSDDEDRPPLSTISTFSDADSSLSFSFHPPDPYFPFPFSASIDPIVVKLTMSLVERNILVEELSSSDRRQCDSVRKIELQRSLLELMESERVLLVAGNARLGYRAAAAEEEGRGLAEEVGYMRRTAAELAKCVERMSEEQRVRALGRRIDVLRGQLAGLERRAGEWREAAESREREMGEVRKEAERLREENRRLRRRVKRGGWWWWPRGIGRRRGGGAQGRKGGKAGAMGRISCWGKNPCFCT